MSSHQPTGSAWPQEKVPRAHGSTIGRASACSDCSNQVNALIIGFWCVAA